MMMKRSLLAMIFLAISQILLSQEAIAPGKHFAKPTEKGVGKIDTRVDNMGYWRRMADSGFVQVAPYDNIPQAYFTGSRIESPMVMSSNSPDVPVTSVNSTQSENSVFIRPSDSTDVINSNNSTPNPVSGIYGANYFLSTNAGTTWGGSVNGAGGGNSGDPTTAIGLDDRYYVGFINNAGGQSVSYSTNLGSSWTPVVAGVKPVGTGTLLDKNHMWIDNSPVSPYEGYLYNAWTCFGGGNDGEIEIVRSVNGGLAWSTQTAISTAVAAGSHNQGVNIQTGPGGEVYIVWGIYDTWPSDETALAMAKSTNGGTSYAAATRIISNIRGIRATETSKNQRVNSFPSVAVDISGGPRNGYIYVVWANIGVPGVNTGPDIDIYMIRSTDGGGNWSTPIKVNQDSPGLGNEHYFPWITCDPVTGSLCVIYYDDRNVGSAQCEVYCSGSNDGGTTWYDFKVSDVAFTPAPIPGLAGGYMGDYLGISARGNRVYPVWPDNRTGTVMSYCSPFILDLSPDAAFTAGNLIPCQDETVIFTDQSIKNPTIWNWTFNPPNVVFTDGTTASSRNPHVSFQALGAYNVQLIAGNANGYDTIVKPGYILINESNPEFTASPVNLNVGGSTTFTDLSTCSPTSYSWNFGAGSSPATANTQGPHVVAYSTPGFKDVMLTTNGGLMMRKNKLILVDAIYCSASATTCDEYISQVVFGTINNSSECTSGSYAKYTHLWTRVSPGIGYPITVTNGLPYTGDQCRIWIDWNQDLDFSDAGETITPSGTPGGGPYTATITTPANAVHGPTRMRIRIMYTGTVSPCGGTEWGEVEDYTVYVGTPGLWEGGTAGSENDWNNPNNWDDGRVPGASQTVVIPEGAESYPVLAGSISCQDILIEDGGHTTIPTGATFNISGNLTVGQGVSGTLTVNGGVCNVAGTVSTLSGGKIEVKNSGVMNDNN